LRPKAAPLSKSVRSRENAVSDTLPEGGWTVEDRVSARCGEIEKENIGQFHFRGRRRDRDADDPRRGCGIRPDGSRRSGALPAHPQSRAPVPTVVPDD
jgi:hypothetical protein